MNRREFAYVTAIARAVAAEAHPPRNNGRLPSIPESAGLITEIVFLDDCVRLAMYDPKLSSTAKTALAAHADFVRNGALSPVSRESKSAPHYALAAGRLCSKALASHRRPNSPEARLFQDVAVMRDLSVAAGSSPDKPAPVGDLLALLHLRRRLAMHTLVPDDGSVAEVQIWLQNVCT